MTLREAVAAGARELEEACPGSPFLDASLLMASVLGCAREALLARLPEPLSDETIDAFRTLIDRRRLGEPVAYILGFREFYGRRFAVDGRVLVPRPETELLVEAALAALPAPSTGASLRAHDGFAGSGCVGITLAAERPDLDISLSDASEEALELCALNSRSILGRELPMALGLGLAAAKAPLDLITANPPYVASSFVDGMRAAGNVEPRMALDGGAFGLDPYAPLARDAYALLRSGGTLVAEIGDEQGAAVSFLFEQAGFSDIRVLKDLAGQDRVVLGVRP